MASQMVPMISALDRYNEAFNVYLSHTNRSANVYKLCSTEIPEAVISTLTGDVDQFNYLGVGSGRGEADIKLLVELRKRYPKIKATIVDPSQATLSDFKENVIKEGLALEDVEFEWKALTVEEYLESGPNNEYFHCILIVGSTPYFVDLEGTMKYLYKILVKTGTIAIVNEQEKNVGRAMSEQFPNVLCTGYKSTPTEKQVAIFNGVGASVRVFEMEAEADITLCWQEDSEDGNLLLDIFTHTVHFRQTAPKDLFEDVLQFLQGPKLLSRKTDSSIFIRDNRDVIIVH